MKFFLIVATFFLSTNIYAMETKLLNQKDVRSDSSDVVIKLTGQAKKPLKSLGDQPDEVVKRIFLCFLSGKDSEEFIQSLRELFILRRVSKKFSKIIGSEEFAKFVGKAIKIDALKFKKLFFVKKKMPSPSELSLLHYAAEKDQKQLINFLIRAGADGNELSGKYGATHYIKPCEAFDLLRKNGIDVDQSQDQFNGDPCSYVALEFIEENEVIQTTHNDAVIATRELEDVRPYRGGKVCCQVVGWIFVGILGLGLIGCLIYFPYVA